MSRVGVLDPDMSHITKVLVPRRRQDSIRRDRLLDALLAHPARPLVLLRAPAGYGKTTLLVDFAHEANFPICWLSLDEWDRDPSTLFQYFALSIGQRFPSLARRWVGMLGCSPTELEGLLGRLVTDLQHAGRETCVILDDFQELDGGSQALRLLEHFVLRMPVHCRLLLATRTTPSLSILPRLRAQRDVLELGSQELAFTVEEIKRYCRSVSKRDTSENDVARILAITEGWPAAVALTAESPNLARQSQNVPERVVDYFAAEMYGRLSPDLQQFLLRTSILETLEPAICDLILGHECSRQLLRDIEARNVPIVKIEGEQEWYRLHSLFRSFVLARFRLDRPEEFRELHRVAGRILAETGSWSEAIAHLAEAGEWDEVMHLISRAAPRLFQSGRWQTVASWLERLPSQELETRPPLQLWQGRILYHLNQGDRVLRVVGSVLARCECGESPLVAGEGYIIRGMALRLKGDYHGAIESCERALELILTHNGPIELMADARKQLGITYGASGAFEAALPELSAALEIYERRGEVGEAALVNHCMGTVLGNLGRLADSIRYLEQARQKWQRLGNEKELSGVLNNLGMALYELGESERASDVFLDALQKAKDSGRTRVEACAWASLADIDRDLGERQRALERYQQALMLAGETGDAALCTQALVGLAETHRTIGDLDRADVIARQAVTDARERKSPYELGIAATALALIVQDYGRTTEATDCLQEAIASLEQVEAKKELARALFHFASFLFAARRQRRTVSQVLDRIAQIVRDLGYSSFLVPLARGSSAVVEYGAGKKLGGGFYQELWKKCAATEVRNPEDMPPAHPFPHIDVQALGDVVVLLDGRRVSRFEWESEKSKEMFLLLIAHDHPLRKEEILAALWPETTPDKRNSIFHSTLYRLRHALYLQCVVEQDGRYGLSPAGSFSCDLSEFLRLVEQLRRPDRASAGWVEAARQVTETYKGPFAPDFYSEWVITLRARLEHEYLRALGQLADRCQADGEYDAAIRLYEDMLKADPYDERACYQVMEAYVALGESEAASRTFRRHAQVLRDELGEEPAPMLVRLYQRLREQ